MTIDDEMRDKARYGIRYKVIPLENIEIREWADVDWCVQMSGPGAYVQAWIWVPNADPGESHA